MANCPARKPISDFPSGRSGTLNCPVRKPASPLGGQHALWPSCFTLCQEACFGPPLLEGLPRGPSLWNRPVPEGGYASRILRDGKGWQRALLCRRRRIFFLLPLQKHLLVQYANNKRLLLQSKETMRVQVGMYGAPLLRGTSV